MLWNNNDTCNKYNVYGAVVMAQSVRELLGWNDRNSAKRPNR